MTLLGFTASASLREYNNLQSFVSLVMKAARRSSRGSPRRPCGGASRVGWASRPPHPASCRMMLLNVLQPPLRKNVRAGRSNRRAGAHPTRETFAAQRRGAVGLQEDNQVWSFCPYSGQPTCKGTRRPLPVPEGLRKLAGGEASPRARTTERLDQIASAPTGRWNALFDGKIHRPSGAHSDGPGVPVVLAALHHRLIRATPNSSRQACWPR